jgi:hypothetical protein
MKLQKVGGYASMLNAVLLVIVLVIMLVVFPRLGLTGLNDSLDPAKNLNAMNAAPAAFYILDVELILFGIASMLMVFALRERMHAGAPNLMRLAVIGVSITAGLWLAQGLIGMAGMPAIVSAKDPSAFRAVMAIFSSLGVAADSALGWALLLIGCAALMTGALPRPLGYFAVLKGIVMIFEFAAQPLMLVGGVLGIIFYPWLGIVLWSGKILPELSIEKT